MQIPAKSIFLSTLLIFSFIRLSAQAFQVKGRVIDFETRDALAFVNIQVNEGPDGCSTDIDGKFVARSSVPVTKLKISYIGYEPLEFVPENDNKEVLIRLKKTAYELSEIIIKPGINPAHRIIRNVLENKFINDHEHLPSFTYTSYEKMIFGPESDSIPEIDSLAADTSYIKAKAFFEKQHLFMMESVSKRSFRFPADNYNKVIASRVSGLSDPLFVFLISQLQSTSFYKEVIKIFDKDYINPISNGSFNKYYFELQDTLIEPFPYDTTFIISYRPLIHTNFDGLKGTISVSTNGYAIRNVIAIPAIDQEMLSVKIQQLYDFIDSVHWFPIQLNTDLIIKNAAISFGKIQMKMMGSGKSYLSHINLNPDLKRNQFGFVEVDVLPDAYIQPEKVWNTYRADSLTSRERMTYKVIDSLGKAENFDRLSKRLDALMNGKIPFRYFDLHLDELFKWNHYEGFRVGLKVSSSDKVSTRFKVGGYTAYGTKDNGFKYGAEAQIIFDRFRNFNLKGAWYDDFDEAGADEVFDQTQSLLKPEKFRNILVERMDHTRCFRVTVSSRMLKYLTIGSGFAYYNHKPLYDYNYLLKTAGNLEVLISDFTFSEASVSLRYAYGEKYLKNTHTAISMGTNYPILNFYYGHGFNGFTGGEFSYNRYDLKISKSLLIKYFGTTSVTLHAGYIDRDIPYVSLYNMTASYSKFSLYSPESFSTMRMNEFTADRYASIFLSHDFGKLLYRSKHFNPKPAIVTNFGIGSLRHPENHQKQELGSFDKGYFESGLIINNLWDLQILNLGAGWFYRYGYYSLPTVKENMAFKLAIQFIL